MIKTIGKDFIPVLISILLVLASIGITIFTNYTLNYKHYIGIGLILISTILYFKNKKLFIYFFGATLLLGTIGQIDFYYVNVLFGIGAPMFNPIFLILLILFLAFNKKLIGKMFPEKIQAEKSVEERLAEKENRIKNYEKKFQSKSESELKRIADENSTHVEEAKIAAINILNEKYML